MDENGNVDEHKGNGGGGPVYSTDVSPDAQSAWKTGVSGHSIHPEAANVTPTDNGNGSSGLGSTPVDGRTKDVTKGERENRTTLPHSDTSPEPGLGSNEEFEETRDNLAADGLVIKINRPALKEAGDMITAATLPKEKLVNYYTRMDKIAESALTYVADVFSDENKQTLETLVERNVRKKLADRAIEKLSVVERDFNIIQEKYNLDITQKSSELEKAEIIMIKAKNGLDVYMNQIRQCNKERKELERDNVEVEQEGKTKEDVIYKTHLVELKAKIRGYSQEVNGLMAKYDGAVRKVNILQRGINKKEEYCDALSVRIGDIVMRKDNLLEAKDLNKEDFLKIVTGIKQEGIKQDCNWLLDDAPKISDALYEKVDQRIDRLNKLPEVKCNTQLYKGVERDTTQDLVDNIEKRYMRSTMFTKA